MMDEKQQNGTCLLKLQIGPVQDFIAQARSTRDLWSGSYLLSWLMAAGLHQLEKGGATIIYPAWDKQPLGKLRKGEPVDFEKVVIPNLPNVLLAEVSADGVQLANDTAKAIQLEWKLIAEEVWKFCGINKIALGDKQRFDAQVRQFLSIAWKLTLRDEAHKNNWSNWITVNGSELNAVRQTRAFDAWNAGGWSVGRLNNKDSLNGRDEAIAGGPGWGDSLPPQFKHLFKNNDWTGSITLIKRLWHLAYLQAKPWKIPAEHFKMPNTCDIAAHDPDAQTRTHDEDDDHSVEELAVSEKHFAVLAFDGDKVGDRIRTFQSAGEHNGFSEKLGRFALEEVKPVVEIYDGRVIYAGGDDVVALLPSDTALACAESLQHAFLKTTGCDASAGIAIAHFKSPLQDVVRAAQMAEKRAKRKLENGGFDCSAVAVTIYTRSGETIEWGCKWKSGGLELYNRINSALEAGKLSAKFPQRVVELLAPYLNQRTELAKSTLAPGFENVVDEIIQCEFAAVCDRQGGSAWTSEVPETILPLLEAYLAKQEGAETKLRAIIGLCQTVAFENRTRDDDAGLRSEIPYPQSQPVERLNP